MAVITTGGGWAIYPDTDTLDEVIERFQDREYLDEEERWGGKPASDYEPVIDRAHNYFAVPWGDHRNIHRHIEQPMLDRAVIGYVRLVYSQEMMAYTYTENGLEEELDILDWWAERNDEKTETTGCV